MQGFILHSIAFACRPPTFLSSVSRLNKLLPLLQIKQSVEYKQDGAYC
jgi:hypothetical protein